MEIAGEIRNRPRSWRSRTDGRKVLSFDVETDPERGGCWYRCQARGAAAAELARRLTPGARVTVRGLPRVVRWLRVPEADSVTVEP